ncbi:MAG: glycosyltransferase family 2 protein [Patescibacteria group bacterium]
MPDPEISIVIVSWNVRDLLIASLRSMDRFVHTACEVVVVDNHSADGTVDLLRREFPAITVIANDRNAGFARANNQGWQRTRGSYICFLNPDTEFINDPFPELLAELKRHPQTGCVAPRLLNADRSLQPSVRRWPQFADQALVLLKLRSMSTWLAPLRRYQVDAGAAGKGRQAVDQVMGAVMVLPRTVLEEAGAFDEKYWIWFEEVDLCQRLKRRGYDVIYLPQAAIVHLGGRSFAQHLSLAKHVWWLKSLARYVGRYWPPLPRYALYLLMPISYVLTVLQTFVKPK